MTAGASLQDALHRLRDALPRDIPAQQLGLRAADAALHGRWDRLLGEDASTRVHARGDVASLLHGFHGVSPLGARANGARAGWAGPVQMRRVALRNALARSEVHSQKKIKKIKGRSARRVRRHVSRGRDGAKQTEKNKQTNNNDNEHEHEHDN